MAVVRRNAGSAQGRDGVCGALLDSGACSEACVLQDDQVWEAAQSLVECGAVVTASDPNYPLAWAHEQAGGTPPVLYFRGDLSPLKAATLTIVGSRQIGIETVRRVREVAQWAVRAGYTIVSGGAPGVDITAERAAIAAGGAVVEIWPQGFGAKWGVGDRERVAWLSAWPPGTGFSAAAAMERNALLYSASRIAYIGHARFKAGGAWHGAVDALRLKRSRLIVPSDGSPAHRALAALGAVQLQPGPIPETMPLAIAQQSMQPWLFAS